MTVHMISCVYILSSSCFGAISSSSLTSRWLLVDRSFFVSWSRWPLAVSIPFGWCFEIRDSVSTSHEIKFLLLIAWIMVHRTGLKHTPERYLASSCFVWSSLIIPIARKIGGLFGIGGLSLPRGILHRPLSLRWPVMIPLLFVRITRLYLENKATQLSSHSWTIDIRDLVARLSKM